MTQPTVYMTRTEYENTFGTDPDVPTHITSVHPSEGGYTLARLEVTDD